ncbi:MAG: amino acid ABC transporter permease [Francisellaceae bacterium]|jgi:His/Glu/Gln/Arg/opine family amino acid ABC transporter permease subunit|nr:amino acid ABC transporter permease [Francisellaceae bacterium]
MSSHNIWYIISGIGLSLQYTILSLIIGTAIGLYIAILRQNSSKVTTHIINFYISILRGTPLLVQLMLIYFAIPALLEINISGYFAGLIAFSLNSSAYLAEIFRAGMQSIPQEQFDSCKTLKIPNFLMMKDIILPQAIRNSLPALVNETTSLLKETAIISTIGEADIMRRAHIVAVENYSYFTPLIIAAICYYILVLIITKAGDTLEHRLYHDKY